MLPLWIPHRLDGTHAGEGSQWATAVGGPGLAAARGAIAGERVAGSIPRTPRPSAGASLASWTRYECVECGVTLHGQHEWEVHQRSKRHRKRRRRGGVAPEMSGGVAGAGG